ncbi:synapse differentiation-inducing gene protein 1-like [Rhineura floridana]|uniref:synapse differentiation-inducing gene protein 1-like n=1 Tax=Rhineura floridana TaxID=261503 RepID=UPI002AC8489A|nr:synapse differentiation-inducing gene protein 1-like [Rhineura floridana]
MSTIKYERMDNEVPAIQSPPPYSEKQPDAESPPMPHQNQPYYSPYSGAQPLQTNFVATVRSTSEPDYLAYSIFTMLCCCLPLGAAAVAYSTQTRLANRDGNSIAARRSSRLALTLSHSALGVGLGLLILYIIFWITTSQQVFEDPLNSP